MAIAVYLLLALLLLLLNAFFVLAEFAAVRIRPSRVEQLVDQGKPRAKLLEHIQTHLDDYLAVCQLGITFASLGLGAVVKPVFAGLIEALTGASSTTASAVAVTVGILLFSFFHVVIGEQVPKMLAIRRPEPTLFAVALPLKVFRLLFLLPLIVLRGATNACLRLFGVSGKEKDRHHSEEELKIILEDSQERGLMSFRRLLFMENIFDLGDVKVRDAMRPRDGVKVLRVGASWEENMGTIRQSRFSRYPLVDGGEMPVGVVHVKDLLYEPPDRLPSADLKAISRSYITTMDDVPLENLLAELQRHRGHLAMVKNAKGKWVGFISLEDIIEEIIGTIEDEFEVEPPLQLADAVTPGRVVLGIQAENLEGVIDQAFKRVPAAELPRPADRLARAVLERERAMSTYLGKGLAIPHARVEGLEKPVLIVARAEPGVAVKRREEKAKLFFILLTPAGAPRVQVRLLARIVALIDSEFVRERLLEAQEPAAVVEAILAGDPATIS